MALTGLMGCIIPALPGPPLSFLALLVLSWAKDWEPFSPAFLITMGGVTLVIAILDYVIPLSGAKKWGASRRGVWGSIIGMIVGFFLFPPWGILLGGVGGALVGEFSAGKGGNRAIRASVGIVMGYMVSTGIKLLFSAVVLILYIKEMF